MTSQRPELTGLSLLLDGYFHQDFRAEHGSHEAAARAFAVEASTEEREAAVRALDRLVTWAETVDREDWQEALTSAGGAWRPRSLAPLREVLAILTAPS
jgi:hypothetical protein